MRKNLYWLSDREWERIEPHVPRDVRGKARVDNRRVSSGIIHCCEMVAAGAIVRPSIAANSLAKRLQKLLRRP